MDTPQNRFILTPSIASGEDILTIGKYAVLALAAAIVGAAANWMPIPTSATFSIRPCSYEANIAAKFNIPVCDAR